MDAFSSVSCSSFSCISMVSLSEACGRGGDSCAVGAGRQACPRPCPPCGPCPGDGGADLERVHELVLGQQRVLLQVLEAAPGLAGQHVELPQVVVQVLHVPLDVLLLPLLLVDLLCGGERGPREGPVPGLVSSGPTSPLPSCPTVFLAPHPGHIPPGPGRGKGVPSGCWFPKPGPLRTWKDRGVASRQVAVRKEDMYVPGERDTDVWERGPCPHAAATKLRGRRRNTATLASSR